MDITPVSELKYVVQYFPDRAVHTRLMLPVDQSIFAPLSLILPPFPKVPRFRFYIEISTITLITEKILTFLR